MTHSVRPAVGVKGRLLTPKGRGGKKTKQNNILPRTDIMKRTLNANYIFI